MSDYFIRLRQDWIREMLHIYGFINITHLMLKFDISRPQASIDLQLFIKENPKYVHYDLSKKAYIRSNA